MAAYPFSPATSDDDEHAMDFDEITDGDIIHSEASPFCNDPSCPCKEDAEEIDRLYQQYQDGEVSIQDRDNIYGGQGRIYNL